MREPGFNVKLEVWDEKDGKGIDDVLAAGKSPDVLTGEAATGFIGDTLKQSAAADPSTQEKKLNEAKKIIGELPARAVKDPGAPFEEKSLDALALIKRTSPEAWARIKPALKKSGVSFNDLTKALRQKQAPLRVAHSGEKADNRTAGTMLPDAPNSQIIIPEPYFLSPDGVGIIERKPIEPGIIGNVSRLISHAPILITRRLRDEEEGIEYFNLTWRRFDGWHELVIDRGAALDPKKLVERAAGGFPVAGDNAKDVAKYLHELEAANYRQFPVTRISSHLGWQGKNGEFGFLWGRNLISPDGGLQIASGPADFSSSETEIAFRGLTSGDEQIADAYHASGTLEGWIKAVAPIQKFPRVLLPVYTSFVPPTLKIVRAPNFTVDSANRTTTGKTTSQRAAASVWGKPDERDPDSAISTWDASPTYLERVSAILSDLPLILDDTKRAKNKQIVSNMLYAVNSGRGRGRGNVRSLAITRTWNTTLISSGEAPAISFTQDGGTRTRTVTNRGLPFGKADDEIRRLVDRLNTEIRCHYGHAGPLFVSWLSKNRCRWNEFGEVYRNNVARYAEQSSAPEAGRLAQFVAVIDLTAALVHAAFKDAGTPLPWSYQDPIKALWESLLLEVEDAAGEIRAMHDVISWACSRPESFYGRHLRDQEGNPRVPQGGWSGKWDSDKDWRFIAFFPPVLNKVLHELGYEPEAILPAWREREWLDLDKDKKRYTKRQRLGSEESPHLVTITRAAIEEVDA